MAKCSKCKKRKAKRYCIGIGDSLCNLCCGILREKEIYCPPSCSFLAKHKSYQEKRIIEKKQASLSHISADEDILNDERMAWLAFHIEMPLKEIGEENEFFQDKDAFLALEYAREKIEKGKVLLFIPDEKTGPKNEVGEAIYKNIEKCRYEKKIIFSGETDTYKREEKIKCLDRIILSVKFMAKGNFESRSYIQKLIERFAKIKELSRHKKIIPVT